MGARLTGGELLWTMNVEEPNRNGFRGGLEAARAKSEETVKQKGSLENSRKRNPCLLIGHDLEALTLKSRILLMSKQSK